MSSLGEVRQIVDDWDPRGLFAGQLNEVDMTDAGRALVMRGYDDGQIAHYGKFRRSGESYFDEHSRNVTLILLACGVKDPNILTAALLHDALEDTRFFGVRGDRKHSQWMQEVRPILGAYYNEEVADMIITMTVPEVDGETEILSKEHAREVHETILENGSEGALLIRMADRLHNLRTRYTNIYSSAKWTSIIERTGKTLPLFERARSVYPVEAENLLVQLRGAMQGPQPFRAPTFSSNS